MEVLVKIALVGLVAWLLTELIPMPGHVKKVLIAAAVLLAILFALPLINNLLAVG